MQIRLSPATPQRLSLVHDPISTERRIFPPELEHPKANAFPRLVRKRRRSELVGKVFSSPLHPEQVSLSYFQKTFSPLAAKHFEVSHSPAEASVNSENKSGSSGKICFRTSQIACQFILALVCARKCIVACSVGHPPNQFVSKLERGCKSAPFH